MDRLKKYFQNAYEWALPDILPFLPQCRIAAGEFPSWIELYHLPPSFCIIRAKFLSPDGFYGMLFAYGGVIAATIAVWVWLGWLGLVPFVILLLPLLIPIFDAPYTKLHLTFQEDGAVLTKTFSGKFYFLFNFDQRYYFHKQAHSEGVLEERRHQMAVAIGQGLKQRIDQGLSDATLGGKPLYPGPVRPPGPPPPNPRIYGDSSELFVWRGVGGSIRVKIADFMDDRQGEQANALEKAIEEAIRIVRLDRARPRPIENRPAADDRSQDDEYS